MLLTILIFISGCYTGEVVRAHYLCSGVQENNIHSKEDVFVFENNLKKKYTDFCEGDYLYAYSCNSGDFSKLSDALVKDEIYCHNGCYDGACLV